MYASKVDYAELLYEAHKNNKEASNKEVRCYKTSFAPPKKLEKSTVSSENIKKFLARKEQEERKKREDAQKKKEELLALRSQDKKAQRRVQVMLKSTKSANKSVMADAVDNVNTRDTLNGTKQCDEDDYGYVSQEASALYNKLISQYENTPTQPPKFQPIKKVVKDLNAAKDRVKAALQKEAEDELLPQKRKRKKNDDHISTESDIKNAAMEKDIKIKTPDAVDKPKKKKKDGPPPMKFDQLLRIAEKKQFEPILIDETTLKKEPERPLTKKQKLEELKQKEVRHKSMKVSSRAKIELPAPGKYKSKNEQKSHITDLLKKKKLGKSTLPANNMQKVKKNKFKTELNASANKVIDSKVLKDRPQNDANVWTPSSSYSVKNLLEDLKNKPSRNSGKTNKKEAKASDLGFNPNLDKLSGTTNKVIDSKELQDRLQNDANVWTQSSSYSVKNLLEDLKNKPSGNSGKTSKKPAKASDLGLNPNLDKLSALELKLKEMQMKQELLKAKLKLQKQEMKDVGSKPASKNKKMVKKPLPEKKKPVTKRRIESDSEYDSELDDFIDDGPQDGNDYSKYISEIFGYDKSKYANVEEDDECMESNFHEISKEEYVSAKIGMLEDLEDIRKEQEEKKRIKERKIKKLMDEKKRKK